MMSGLEVIFAYTDADGWHPGIGDPTLMGWLTVAGYFVAAYLAYRASRFAQMRMDRHACRFWLVLSGVLAGLGVNKQLDLQTWLTFVGKRAAQSQGWYESRHWVQAAFILLVAAAAAASVWWGWRCVRHRAMELWLPLLGFCLLLAFVVIRAASFHHFDQILHLRLAGLKMNWILELGAIGLLIWSTRPHLPAAAARRRPRQRTRVA